MSNNQKNYILEQKINILQQKINILEQNIHHLHVMIINKSYREFNLDNEYQYRSISTLKPPKLTRQNAFYISTDSPNVFENL
tara:strand:+ start:127 stop:372 length:246 start_codon:yes stop_codon:yes gene_type:complete